MERDIKKEFTLKEICKIMKIKVPKELKDIENIPRSNFTLRKKDITKGTVYFGGGDFIEDSNYYQQLFDLGADIIFISEKEYKKYPPLKNDPRVIKIKKYIEKQGEFFNYYKEQYQIPTIAITGSVGKTTTTQLMQLIFEKKYNLFKYSGNWNTASSVANHITTGLTEENDMYIQECGAGDLRSIEKSARMLRPDAYILTNVLPHHLNGYGTYENIFKDKTIFSKFLKRKGVLVTNYDDENIANHKFHHKVIKVGINTKKKVDYRAVNIEQNGEFLEFDILYKDKKFHAKINIVGKHNAYNVLCAFAMAKHYKIKNSLIRKALSEFKTKGIRQNIQNIGGITFFIDCYNVCNENIKAGIKAMEEMNIGEHNKKIAIIGGENKLGENYYDISYSLGKEIKDCKLDYIICFSQADETQEQIDYYGESKPIYKALKDNGFENCSLIETREDLIKKMKEMLKPGDACLVKGNFELNMTMAIDEIYGTSLTMDNESIPERNRIIEDKEFKIKVNDDFKKADLIEYTGKDVKNITIPDSIAKYPIFRIKGKMFRETENLETINFGKSVENIGFACFARNKKLKEVTIPKNIKWISASAFALCENLEKVVIEEGTINISKNAFYKCSNLKEIHIPASVKHIDEKAFSKCENLVVFCKKNSYASKFCNDLNLNAKYVK